MNREEFFASYTSALCSLLQGLDTSVMNRVIEALENVHDCNGKIYIIGNGGSAATASHMANDLGVGLKLREIRNFNVESLSDNSSVCTAIANDIGYENIFYAQIKNKIQANDLLIAISCSGNSANIIKAVEYAKSIGTPIIGLSGFEGGKLFGLCDIQFHIPTGKGEYGIVEDMHMIFDHMIYSYYVSLKPQTKSTYTIQ